MLSKIVKVDGIEYTISVTSGEDSLKEAIRQFKKSLKDEKKRNKEQE